ncbi:MAG TPA: methylated-DNA--[protein]-cysteine S-methyltransferase [Dehalococcoidia bacterium]|nr:methylated-DNA--[protein]-cysteine S-methyltransferase [Dehalococcoidia bacterium]
MKSGPGRVGRDGEPSCKVVPTALGWMGLVFSERGLRAVTLPRPSRQEAEAEVRALGARRPARGRLALQMARRLQDYARGLPVSFHDVPLDWDDLSPFQRAVLQALWRLPRGQVTTYGELARLVGRPGAARAVGRAMATNPLPIVVPCHRVVGADGSLTGYGGGLELKARLLELEGVSPPGAAARASRQPAGRQPRLPMSAQDALRR